MQDVVLKIRYFERRLLRSLEKLSLFFLLNPLPFDGQDYKKQKGPETSDQSLIRLQNNFRKKNLISNVLLPVLV